MASWRVLPKRLRTKTSSISLSCYIMKKNLSFHKIGKNNQRALRSMLGSSWEISQVSADCPVRGESWKCRLSSLRLKTVWKWLVQKWIVDSFLSLNLFWKILGTVGKFGMHIIETFPLRSVCKWLHEWCSKANSAGLFGSYVLGKNMS